MGRHWLYPSFQHHRAIPSMETAPPTHAGETATSDQQEGVASSASSSSSEGISPTTPLVGRLQVKEILGREDGGLGLVEKKVVLAGWIKTVRFGNKNRLAFINLNDGSSLGGIQIVVDESREGFDQLRRTECATGASLWVSGQVVKSPGKGQAVEVLAGQVALLGGCPPLEYPLAGKKDFSMEYLRDVAHLRARTNTVRIAISSPLLFLLLQLTWLTFECLLCSSVRWRV